LQDAACQRQSDRKNKKRQVEDKESDNDNEAERKYWLAQINMKIIEALEHLDFAIQELPLLKHKKEIEEKEQQQQKNTSGSGSRTSSTSSNKNDKKNQHKQEYKIDGPTNSGKPFVYKIGADQSEKNDKIKNLPLDIARELGVLKVSHQGAMAAAEALSAKKLNPNIGGSTGGTSIVRGTEIPTTAPGPPIGPLRLGPVDGVHELKAKARETVFRESNPPVIGLEEWAELMQEHNQLPTPEQSAQTIAESKKNRKKEKREAAKKGHVTRVKVFNGDMAPEALSDEDESTDDEDEPTEEESDQQTKKAREWENWKDDHERGAGNRNFKK